MAYGKISSKQKEILEYIKQEILNKGYPPAVREICEAVNLKSTSSVHSHLETLEKNGYIRRDPTKTRAIEIIDDSFNLTRREVVNVPLIGSVAAGQPILAVENITIRCSRLTLYKNIIPIENTCINHTFSLNSKHKAFCIWHKLCRNRKIAGNIFYCKNRLSYSNTSYHRNINNLTSG